MNGPASSGPTPIVLITGIMASGKSAVAQALAERLPRSVHVRGDAFRRMVVNGRAEMRPDPEPEAIEQLRLRYRLAAEVAKAFSDAGFAAVVQDVVLGPALDEVVRLYDGYPLRVVVLCPAPDVVARREAERAKKGYGPWSVAHLDRILRTETPRLGLWLDTSELGVEQTADAILADLQHSP